MNRKLTGILLGGALALTAGTASARDHWDHGRGPDHGYHGGHYEHRTVVVERPAYRGGYYPAHRVYYGPAYGPHYWQPAGYWAPTPAPRYYVPGGVSLTIGVGDRW